MKRLFQSKPGLAIKRRSVLSFLMLVAASGIAKAQIIFGGKPFDRVLTPPPIPVDPMAGWQFFTPKEAATIEAIVDRLIPSDELGAGGREAGCAIFIDRQLAGPYGQSAIWYLQGPAAPGLPQQGPQFTNTIAQRYRIGLAALDRFCQTKHGNRSFNTLAPDTQQQILQQMEHGQIALDGADAKTFFEQLLKNTREGFFADPLYGGNADMVGWKMVGFPGARYDYRDYIDRHNEALGLAPVSLFTRGDR